MANLSPVTPEFSVDFLPDAEDPRWKMYVKTVPTRMMRMPGPFRVMTSESENEPFYCEDGYLAIDARGYPYAIAANEQEKIYRLVSND